jgi:hypothetical protein
VSRGGGCAIGADRTPGFGAALVFVLMPAALWFRGRKRRKR